MKFSKKLGLALGVGVSLGVILTGCSGKTTSDSKDKSSSQDKVTIRFSWWGNDDRHKATLAMIDKFETAYPNVEVKAEYSGWDGIEEKMTTQIAGGTEADLMQMGMDWYLVYSPDGTGFYDLNKVKDIVDFSQYDDMAIGQGTIKDKLNGIVYNQNMSSMALNKTAYEKLGIDPTSLKTWDDYKEAAKKFPEGSYPIGSNSFYFVTIYLAQKYGKPFMDKEGNLNYSAAQVQEGLEWKKGLEDAKVIPPTKEFIENVGSNSMATVKQFIDGQYAGVSEWAQNAGSFKTTLEENGQELIMADFPTIDGAKNAGVAVAPSMLFSISKHSKHPKEAAELLNFMLNEKEGILALGTTRGIPGNEQAIKVLNDAGKLSDFDNEIIDYMERTEGASQSPYYGQASTLSIYSDVINNYGLGAMSSKEAAKSLVDQIESAVADVKNNQ